MWIPQPGPQADAISARWCPELFYGGARGGGKSDFLLGDFLQDVATYGNAWQGVIFRQSYPELQRLIKRSFEVYALTGAVWKEQAKEWAWPNGACLRFRYLENVRDARHYQGHEWTWIGWDELPEWQTLEAYFMLLACLRSPHDVKCKRIRASGNPGGPGHLAVKQYFIDPAPAGFKCIDNIRMFIPAKVTDNKILLKADPGYIERLRRTGTIELVRMWLEGDWNQIAGAYFSSFSAAKHIIAPRPLPEHWQKFTGFDYGHASPFCNLWAALSDGVEVKDGKNVASDIPKGTIVIYREWYGWNGTPNQGLKLRIEDIGNGIKEREFEKIAYRVADPSIFKEEGGPSIAEALRKVGVNFIRADNSRIPGWQQIHSRFVGDKEPALLIFNTCTNLIRTLPALQHDEKHPDEVADGYEDHAPDALRYVCMSRPYTSTPVEPKPIKVLQHMTYNEFMNEHKKPKHATGF